MFLILVSMLVGVFIHALSKITLLAITLIQAAGAILICETTFMIMLSMLMLITGLLQITVSTHRDGGRAYREGWHDHNAGDIAAYCHGRHAHNYGGCADSRVGHYHVDGLFAHDYGELYHNCHGRGPNHGAHAHMEGLVFNTVGAITILVIMLMMILICCHYCGGPVPHHG